MPANPMRGETVLKDGDRDLKLVLDIEAFCFAEEMMGMSLSAILGMMGGLSVRPVRAILWAALQRHHECPPVEASDIIARVGLQEADAKIAALLKQVFPQVKAEAENPQTAADGTGSNGSAGGAQKG